MLLCSNGSGTVPLHAPDLPPSPPSAAGGRFRGRRQSAAQQHSRHTPTQPRQNAVHTSATAAKMN
jgi:hypothetical protein